MKRELAVFLAACTLLLAACAGLAVSDPLPQAEAPEEAAEIYDAPEYEVVPFTFGNQVRSKDRETVLAVFNYQTLQLSVRNPDAVSPEDAARAARNVEVFNSKMEEITAELGEQEAAVTAAAEAAAASSPLSAEYEDSAEMSAVFCGDVISTCLHRWGYTGGAHPNRYAVSYLFDLAAGQFIDPIQLADDPEAFRTGVEELLLEKAEEDARRENFWEDYASVVARWNEAGLEFDGQGLSVIFSPYELGPYSCGEITLHLGWEELEPLLGPGGMERLGQVEAE